MKRQATNTLKCMQTLARVQSQIRSRRIRMSEDNQALQRQLLQKHAKDLENLRVSFITLISVIIYMNFSINGSMIGSLNLALLDCVGICLEKVLRNC